MTEQELSEYVDKAHRRPKVTTYDQLRKSVPKLVSEIRHLHKIIEYLSNALEDQDVCIEETTGDDGLPTLRVRTARDWIKEAEEATDEA